jgi:uncharacterized tellurite resistance protein B-like protein
MLKAIRALFDQHDTGDGQHDPQRLVQIASAALWLELMRADGRISASEREAVLSAVSAKFGLDAGQARMLVHNAEAAAAQATDDFEFTSLINRNCTAKQKERVVEQLWHVAYADGELHAHEEHFVRRIAELLYVSHGAYIAAKLRAAKGNRRSEQTGSEEERGS